jgi:hypothetical protein
MSGKQAKILHEQQINDLLVFASATRNPLRNKLIVLLSVKAGLRAGDSEPLDVAIRVDQEVDAYGWNNETYFYQNWRNPQRKLNHKRYLVEVIVTSSGSKRRGVFRLDNDGPFTDFRLAELTLTQRQAVGV